MQRLKKLLFVSSAIMLLVAPARGHAQNVDCRSCHASNIAVGIMDFSQIYAESSTHHSVGVEYPAGVNIKPNYNRPNGKSAGITFFDRNHNGQPDDDEIQLFGGGGIATVECSSCHREHGNTPAPADAIRNSYLRFDNADSGMCTTCHNY